MLRCSSFCAFLIWILSAFPLHAAQTSGTLTFSTTYRPPISTPSQDGMLDKWLQAVFKELNMEVKIYTPSAENSLRQGNAGIDDGVGPRIAGLEKKYPNLLMIDEPILEQHFVAFTLSGKEFSTKDWDSLTPYKTGIVKGHKILEKNIAKAVRLSNPKALFSALQRGIIDVAVINIFTGIATAEKVLGAGNFKTLSPPLVSKQMYMYLHKKHAGLVEKAAQAMRDLKAKGEYEKIMRLEEITGSK